MPLLSLPAVSSTLRKTFLSIPCALFVGFFAFYFFAGQQLQDTPIFQRDDVFFRADTFRAMKDITGDRQQNHVHTSGHPNFVILTQPIGYNLRSHIRNSHKGMTVNEASRLASIRVTSGAGALIASLFYGLLVANGIPRGRSVLFTIVLGCSATHMFYASTPETYIFSALGLTAVAFVASRKDLSESWWHFASVYAWSILTTNIALVGIWALARHWQTPLKAVVIKVTKVIAITVALMVALSLLQAAIYPKTMIFFLPNSVARESGWLYWDRLLSPLATSRTLLQHIWMSNIIGPEPVRQIVFDKPMASIEAGTWEMIAPSLPLLSLWIVFLVGAVTALFQRAFYRPTIIAALAALAFNFAFFFIFGHDRMLYAALWTFTAVMVVAVGIENLLERLPKLATPATALLILLVAGEAWHNWHFLGKLAAAVQ